MKKKLAIAISLLVSSSAFASSTDLASVNLTSAPLNIKFSDLINDTGTPYCMYSTMVSAEQCSQQVIACSDNGDFVFSTELEMNKKFLNAITIKNEQTSETVAQGAVVLAVDGTPKFEISDKYGLENVNYYHTDEGVEFFLKPAADKAIVLFSEEDRLGDTLEIVSDKADLGQFNAEMDSYTIPDHWTLRFYEGKNFQGRYYTRGELRHGSYDGTNFEPRVSSVRVVKEGESLDVLREEDRKKPAVVLYNEAQYSGKQLTVRSDLANLGEFNSDVDSYVIPEDWIVRFYSEKNYQGRYYSRSGGTLGLGVVDNDDFEPRIQSVRILKRTEDGSVVLFSEQNHQGRQLGILADTADLGDFNQDMDSYTIPEGWTVRFYEGKDFQGTYHTRGIDEESNQTDGSFDSADFSPRVKSIRIIQK